MLLVEEEIPIDFEAIQRVTSKTLPGDSTLIGNQKVRLGQPNKKLNLLYDRDCFIQRSLLSNYFSIYKIFTSLNQLH